MHRNRLMTAPLYYRNMHAVLRIAMLLVTIAVCTALVVTHGIRGFVVIAFVAIIATVPRTRAYAYVERWLVRLTGSRGRAALLVGLVSLSALIALNVIQFVR